MMLVLPSGYILQVEGPYGANGGNNDATIMQQILLEITLKNYLDANDRLVVDRGFRNCQGELEDEGYGVFMPEFLAKNQAQF